MLRYLAPIALICAGCGNGLGDKDFKGQPLATVSGTLQSNITTPRAVNVALVWGKPMTDLSQDTPSAVFPVASTDARVGTSFPASFMLSVDCQ